MKISFGYYNINSKFQTFTFHLCKRLKFLPTFIIFLNNITVNGNPSRVKHEITFDFFNYSFKWEYRNVNGIYVWKFYKI